MPTNPPVSVNPSVELATEELVALEAAVHTTRTARDELRASLPATPAEWLAEHHAAWQQAYLAYGAAVSRAQDALTAHAQQTGHPRHKVEAAVKAAATA
ncbi:hypothetical protein ACFQLX_02055 [Streptomyces polyrhachis]|uniref:Uncharacterized protein n=1 Tax=Streptomyces polyrhachis TaxID=1282885 RepID=A0ABW2GBB6_9ACTN